MSMDLVTGTVGSYIATGNGIIQDHVGENQVTVELSGVIQHHIGEDQLLCVHVHGPGRGDSWCLHCHR